MAESFNLPPELHEQVRRIAAAEGRSISQTLRVAIEEYVRRNDRAAKIGEISTRIGSQDEELLRRLS